MVVQRTSKEIIFRIPASVKIDDLQDLADLFEFKQLTKKSKANQKDLDNLLGEMKKGRWQKTKAKLGI